MSEDSAPSRRKLLVIVDDSPECKLALHYAAQRAKHASGQAVLLFIVPPTDFEHWMSVEKAIREEAHAEAEELLDGAAQEVFQISRIAPERMVREGEPKDVIRTVVTEDPDVAVLILAASTSKDGPGPLVSAFTGSVDSFGPRAVPVVVIPGSMTPEEIEAIA
ncbi:MAG: universal stress protein [Pseudomonadota bacterium]